MLKFHESCLATVYSPVVVAVVVDRPVAVKYQSILTGLKSLGPYKKNCITTVVKEVVEHIKRKIALGYYPDPSMNVK
jgi:hypothetical protein